MLFKFKNLKNERKQKSKKLNNALSNKEYRKLQMKAENNYCFICAKRAGSYYHSCSLKVFRAKGSHGDGKYIFTHKYRSYKTWKHNRSTQYKICVD